MGRLEVGVEIRVVVSWGKDTVWVGEKLCPLYVYLHKKRWGSTCIAPNIF